MKKKVTPRDIIDIIIYTLCISVILMVLVDSTFKLVNIKYDFWIMSAVVIGAILYIYIIHRIKYAWISLVLMFLIPRPFYIIRFFKTLISGLHGFINSIVENQYIVEEYVRYFANIVIIIIPIVVLLFYIIVVVKKQTLPLIIFGGALISVYYFIGLDNLIRNCNIFLIASFVLYSYNNYSIMWDRLDRQNINIERKYYIRVIVTNIILVIIVNFAAGIFPADRDPISLNWFQTNVFQRLENIQGEDAELSDSSYKSKFSLSHTGFQQDARRLGGPVKDDNTLALLIKSKDDIGGVHLRGTVKDSYSGFAWDKSDNKTLKFKDELQVNEYNLGYQFKEMEIIHEGLKTSTAFNALYPYMLTNSYKYGFIDSDLETFNPKVIKQGRSYSVKFKEYNISQNVLLERVKNKVKPDSSYDKYLKLPNGIPQRVYDLVHEITDDYESPYMKASAIENYLKTNFPYSKDTSILPEGREFVDYFIFDEQKGSCSYYATALAVMTRMIEIPSRYVEGFVVPYTQDSQGYRKILNSDAHAWVELYFEGVGWVTFDPTPGNTSSAFQFVNDNGNDDDTEVNNMEQNGSANANEQNKDNNQTRSDEIDSSMPNTEKSISWKLIVLNVSVSIILIGVLLFIVSIIVYILINVFIKSNRRILDYSKYKMILFGSLVSIPYYEGETLREYLEVLSKKLNINLGCYIKIYEKALYGKHEVTAEEKDEIIERMLEARKNVIAYMGKMKFYYFDYINTMQFYVGKNKINK